MDVGIGEYLALCSVLFGEAISVPEFGNPTVIQTVAVQKHEQTLRFGCRDQTVEHLQRGETS